MKSTKKTTSNLEEKIGVVALYLRGLQFHRTDAGYLLMEYITYMELTEKIENPNKNIKNWIQAYNKYALDRVRCKDVIVRYVCDHMGYNAYRVLNVLFGKGEWVMPDSPTHRFSD